MAKKTTKATQRKTSREIMNARVYAQIGEAVVAWSHVDNYWAFIFRDVLFHRIGEKPGRDAETSGREEPVDIEEKIKRADAVYYSVSNSESQRSLIVSVAQEALKDRPEELSKLKALMTETRTLAPVRNAIVHAYYDQFWVQKKSKFVLEPLQMKGTNTKKQVKDIDILKSAREFKTLASKLLSLWTSIWEGE